MVSRAVGRRLARGRRADIDTARRRSSGTTSTSSPISSASASAIDPSSRRNSNTCEQIASGQAPANGIETTPSVARIPLGLNDNAGQTPGERFGGVAGVAVCPAAHDLEAGPDLARVSLQIIQQERQKRRMPDRDEPQIACAAEVFECLFAPRVERRRVSHRRRHGHERIDAISPPAAEVFTVVFEADWHLR